LLQKSTNLGLIKNNDNMALSVHRAGRKTEFWKSQTPNNVGPGSYEFTPINSNPQQVSAPFAVSSERSVSAKLQRAPLNESFPGPGAYDQESILRETLTGRYGSNNFVNRTPRIAPIAPGCTVYTYPTSYKTPGPGAYNPDSPNSKPKKKKSSSQRSRSVIVQPTPPSIPSLVRSSKERKDEVYTGRDNDTVGPAFYTPHVEITKPQPVASAFSSYKEKRKIFEHDNSYHNRLPSKDVPPPGEYYSEQTSPKEATGSSCFVSKVRKAHQMNVAETKITPGPGYYEPNLLKQQQFSTAQCFGSKIARSDTWARDSELPYVDPERIGNPGVGSYTLDEHQRKEEERKRKAVTNELVQVQTTPFNSTSKRHCLSTKVEKKPGPGYYNPKAADSQSFSGRVLSGNAKFVYNEQRFKGLFEPKKGPGPGAYDKEEQGQMVDENSVFKSKSTRLPEKHNPHPEIVRIGDTSTPAVGSYNITGELKGKQTRAPDYHMLKTGMSFESSAMRFSEKDSFFGHKISSNPGPGSYTRSSSQPSPQAPKILKSKRFSGFGHFKRPTGTNESVGPGTYYQDQGFVKKSHNLSIESPNLTAMKPWT
jgi:hypothetical protein